MAGLINTINMKKEILKIAGVKSEKEFYKKFPDEASFMKAHGKEFKKAMRESKMEKAQPGTIVGPGGGYSWAPSSGFGAGTNINTSWSGQPVDPLAYYKTTGNKKKYQIGIGQGGSGGAGGGKLDMVNITQGVGDIIGGISALKQQKQDVAGAKQRMKLSGVQVDAAESRPLQPIKRQYIRPEDVVYQPEQMFPSYGVGTNVLAEDGAVINQIGGNPTEIMNTFAPNTIYSDMGYEPLSDSDRVKQYYYGGGIPKAAGGFDFSSFMGSGGADAIGMGIGALTSKGGYEEAGSSIGGGIGRTIGSFFGPMGGTIGDLAGRFIGGAIDQSSERIAQYNKQSQQNIGRLMGSQAGMQFQNQFAANVRNGGNIPEAQDGWVQRAANAQLRKDEKCRKFDEDPYMGGGRSGRDKKDKSKSSTSAPLNMYEDVYYGSFPKDQRKSLEQTYNTLVSEGKLSSDIPVKDFIAAQGEANRINSFFANDYYAEDFFDPANPNVVLSDQIRNVPNSVQFYRLMVPGIGKVEKGRRQLTPLDILNLMPIEKRKEIILKNYPRTQQENGGETSEYKWISHTWQPQVITHFGEHKVSDLLRPPADADMLRAGGEVRNLRKNYISEDERILTNMAFGGQIETTWGGHAEPISQNPYMPATGQTIMFRGQSHDESDGKGRTGIGVKYGKPDSYTEYAEYGTTSDADVEVERNEPAVEMPNGDGENSMVVFGNLKVPNQFLDEIGDPKAKGKKFKTYVKDLAKKENRQTKIIDKASEKLDNLDPLTPFDRLKFNSLSASIEGANMKLKQFAEFKQNAAAVQNAINDTAEEMGLDADKLAKGKVKIDEKAFEGEAKYGKNIKKAQGGSTTPASDDNALTTELGETITEDDLKRLRAMYEKAKGQKKGQAVVEFQREFHRLFPKSALKYNKETKFLTAKAKGLGVKKEDLDKIDINNLSGDLERRVLQGNEDKFFGPITTKYMAIAEGAKKRKIPKQELVKLEELDEKEKTTTGDETTRYPVTASKKKPFLGLASQLLDYIRPSDVEPLDPMQLSGELFALSQNQVEPVWAQKLQPRLGVPMDISLQDILNENEATFRAQQRMFGYSPAAQAELAANKYAANQKVLGEQFRLNQGEKQRVYEKNRDILNQYDLTNLGILDQQYVRQNEALSRTKATTQEALNSIASKVAQNKLENRTLATYENLYNYRFDPRFRARSFQVADFAEPTVYNAAAQKGEVPVYDKEGNLLYYKIPSDKTTTATAKKGKSVGNREQRNSSIVKALKNL